MMSNTDDDDTFTLVMLAAGSLGGLVAAAASLAAFAWETTLTWLLDHHLVVPATAAPLLPLPNAQGAGLDSNRCLIAGAVITLILYLFTSRLRRRWTARKALG